MYQYYINIENVPTKTEPAPRSYSNFLHYTIVIKLPTFLNCPLDVTSCVSQTCLTLGGRIGIKTGFLSSGTLLRRGIIRAFGYPLEVRTGAVSMSDNLSSL